MKIVHLSTYDVAGGAARSAYRLHTGLRQAGIHSSMFVREARTKDDSVITFEPTQKFWGRVERRIRRAGIRRKLSPSVKNKVPNSNRSAVIVRNMAET